MKRIFTAALVPFMLAAGLFTASPAQAAPSCLRHIYSFTDMTLGNIKVYFLYTDLNSASGGYGTFAQAVVITDGLTQAGSSWSAFKVNYDYTDGTMAGSSFVNNKWKMSRYPNISGVKASTINIKYSDITVLRFRDTPYPLVPSRLGTVAIDSGTGLPSSLGAPSSYDNVCPS